MLHFVGEEIPMWSHHWEVWDFKLFARASWSVSNSPVTEQVKGRQDVFSSVSSLAVIEFDMGTLGEKIQVLSRGVVPY